MAKFIPNDILDAMLRAAESTQLHVCRDQPTTYADLGTSTGGGTGGGLTLATKAVTTQPEADAAGGGRELQYNAVTGMTILDTATATHIAISNNTDTLFHVTTCTSQALTSGGTVDTTAYKHTLTDPS